jgi:ATP-dependent Clp protease ATP-binding subunit ClpC
MDLVPFLGAFVAGLTIGVLAAYGRQAVARKSAPPVLERPETPPVQPAVRLQQLTDTLNKVGDESAHPRDLPASETFREAVALMTSGEMSVREVADYATGANWTLAAAACAALTARSDGADALAPVLAAFRHMRPWTIYYALRFIESLGDRPPAGVVILHAPEWWEDHPVIPGFLAEHFATRASMGDLPQFGGALSRVPLSELPALEKLLQKIDDAMARQLLDLLAAHQRSAIDRDHLQSFGRFVEIAPERALLVEHEAIREELARADACIAQAPPRSLLIVGEPRSGKTAFVHLLAGRAQSAGWTLFEAGAAQLQAGQVYIGQLEERLARLATDLAVEKRILWHVSDFLHLVLSGAHRGQSATILDQVLPAVASGRLLLLGEVTPDALTRVLQQRPAVRTALELVRLCPLTEAETNTLTAEAAVRLAQHTGVAIPPDVLDTATHLARHYLGTGQMPGVVLDLLKLSVGRAVSHDASQLQREDVLATISQLTGMPQRVLDDRERVDLASLRAFFSSRVIGQDEAVETVVDRIAMLKAGLTDPARPVGVFLFAGPTGTGKTELAKALAAFLFGSPERLIRLDMSEFQTGEATRKIIGEPDAQGEGQALTDRVRKQPFSVVLLDEFEKAHPNVWDLFLQVFDDGRLSDATGRTVDFRHCIIILTSNVGSTIRQDSGPGFLAHAAGLTPQHVLRAIGRSFRPEFVNRIDRIIVFRPLGREEMRSIVGKELAHVLGRRGLRHREWAVEWETSALEFLLDKGFSPAMGARPLKRAIDQHLLAPLAATLVEHRFPEGDQFLFVRSDGKGLQVEFVDPDAAETGASGADAEGRIGAAAPTLGRLMLQPAGLPAEVAALGVELARLEQALTEERWTTLESTLVSAMQQPDFWNRPDRRAVLSRYEVVDRVKAAVSGARSLAARLERAADASGRSSREFIVRLASQLFALRHGVDDALTDAPVEVVLSVAPMSDRTVHDAAGLQWCERLVEMYRRWAGRRGMQLRVVSRAATERPLLVVSGFGASRLLAGEAGLHVLEYEEGEKTARAIARVLAAPTPPDLPEAPGEQHSVLSRLLEAAPASSVVVRRYRIDASPLIRDVRAGWRTGRADLVFDGHFDVMCDLLLAADQNV